ncbi:MAG: Na+/H+ antiporter NhaA [Pseudomonadota bacterium]
MRLPDRPDAPVPDPATEHTLGPAGARHQLIQYGSYACVHCREAQPVVDRVRQHFGDDLLFVFRHRPYTADPWAVPSAILAELAARRGRFWDAHTLLMRQPITSEAELIEAAGTLGITAAELEAARNDPELVAKVDDAAMAAADYGVVSTPTFFVNGHRYDGPWDEMSLVEALDAPVARRVERVAEAFAGWAPATGLLLAVCAIVALIVANSPLADAYRALWQLPLGLSIGDWSFALPVRGWIDDFLMSVFFLVVGLEIKRELTIGELSRPRDAALPIAAAVGGMVVPAALYLALTWGTPAVSGWGVPMATDIAFSLGLLALLGRRVPTSLKVFLTALAIVDDLGAIVVIALFYGHGFEPTYALAALACVGILVALNVSGVYSVLPYALVGLALWACVHESGLHATLAGILLAATVPTRPPPNLRALLAQAKAVTEPEMERLLREAGAMPRRAVVQMLDRVHDRVESPAHRLERTLEPWSSFLILPLFALANAGVALGDSGGSFTIAAAIGVGLVIGKPAGIVGAVWLLQRFTGTALPAGANWRSLAGVGALAGVGFTMSIFIANQGFADGGDIGIAKIAVLVASALSGLIGYVLLHRSLPDVQARSA